jgi:predicted MFS family arabinose efflux permease
VAVAAASAMVIVNTVVRVKTVLGGDDGLVALHFAAYGAGSMAVALVLPRLLDRLAARPVMLTGGAATALALISFHWLFAGTALGFLASAALVASSGLPRAERRAQTAPFLKRVTRGGWIYLATPRLRGLLALYVAVAAASAMVIVNTVVRVKAQLGGDDGLVALHFAAYGAGSMAVALILPRLLGGVAPRAAMLTGGGATAAGLTLGATGPGFGEGLALWAGLGAAVSLIQTPSGLILRRSCHAEDRPALFAAQFALSHACWLAAYPLAGLLGAAIGLEATFAVMAALALLGVGAAARLWPADDPAEVEHVHPAVEHAHGGGDAAHHAQAEDLGGGRHRHGPLRHAHAFVIDDHHPRWPTAPA